MKNTFPSFEQIENVRMQLKTVTIQHWLHDDFLTWRWWLLVLFTVVPYVIWWRIVDKKRASVILLFGLFVALCAFVLDDIGTTLLWWGYPDKLIPVVPPLLTPDLILVPVFLMIVYQIAHSWRSFVVWNIIIGLLMAYLGEPLFIWLGYYHLNSWRLEYSFSFYMAVAVLGRWLVMKVMSESAATSS